MTPITPEQLDALLSETPFRRFRIHLNDADVVEINDPHGVYIMGATAHIYTFKRGQPHRAESHRLVPLSHITRIDHLYSSTP